nr:alpha/beta hydrolases superfamily protein [Tanacetum cinerariifolium]GEZ27799.1 alpha/beta hydrolases superfamily protein [Tanacetum cinerariifolium]
DKKSFQQRNDKKGKSDRKCFRCGDPNHLIGECPKPPRNKDQKAFVKGSWSDSENEADDKTNEETCLMVESSNEVTLDSSHFSDNASSFDDNVNNNAGEEEAIERKVKLDNDNLEDESIEVDEVVNIKESKSHPLEQSHRNVSLLDVVAKKVVTYFYGLSSRLLDKVLLNSMAPLLSNIIRTSSSRMS